MKSSQMNGLRSMLPARLSVAAASRLWLAVLAILYAAVDPAAAQLFPSTSTQEPEFEIESIRVEGLEHGPETAVLNQSLLLPGVRTTESALRRAIHRVRRLPFVYDATMRLERGSERGRHILVIQVVESHRFFSRFEVRYRNYTLANDDPNLRNDHDVPDIAVGGRLFVGANGVLFAGLDDDEGGFAAGYTQYNLFGTRARATLTLRRGACCSGDDEDDRFGRRLDEDLVRLGDLRGVSLLFSAPLRGSHSLHVEASHLRNDDGTLDLAVGPPLDPDDPPDPGELQSFAYRLETRLTQVQASWVFDTRDDVFLPRSGMRAEAGARHLQSELDIGALLLGPEGVTPPNPDLVEQLYQGSDQNDLFVDVTHHWLLPRGTLTAGGDLRYSESSSRFSRDATYTSAELGYALPLLETKLESAGRFRFEARWRHRWIEFDRSRPPFFPVVQANSVDDGFLYAGLAFRNRWTVLRVGARIDYGLDTRRFGVDP